VRSHVIALGLICVALQLVVIEVSVGGVARPLVSEGMSNADIIYTLIVDSEGAARRMAHVRIVIARPPSMLKLSFDVDGQVRKLGLLRPVSIMNLTAASDRGEILQISSSAEAGWPSWSIWASQAKVVTINYDLVMDYYFEPLDFHSGYLTRTFGMSTGFWTFLAPGGFTRSPVLANFSLPPGWEVYAPWDRQGSMWYARSLEYFLTSTFALGAFQVLTGRVADTEISVAVWDKLDRMEQEEVAKDVFRIFGYYATQVFGKSPIDRYFVIYAPTADDGKRISNCEWSQSQGLSIMDAFSRRIEFAHRIFHIWNVFPPTGMQASATEQDFAWWSAEGIAMYYNTRILLDLAYEKHNYELLKYLNQYLTEYLGTENDLPLTEAWKAIVNQANNWRYTFIAYRKGALVSFLMDSLLRKLTGENKSLDDFMKRLYQRYGDMNGVYSNANLVTLLGSVGRYDFRLFFDKYIFGKEKLPLKIVSDDVAVDWPELLSALKLSKIPLMTLNLSNNLPRVGQTVRLTVTLVSIDGKPIANQTINLYLNSTLIGSAATDQSGLSTLTFRVEASPGTYQLVADYAGSSLFSGTKETAVLTVLLAEALATTTAVVSITEMSTEASTFSSRMAFVQTDWPYLILALMVAAIAVVFVAHRLRSRPQ
jgi:predicted metalloprotease with PDZ domain